MTDERLNQIAEALKMLADFAYENGFHEMGYDPVDEAITELRQLRAIVEKLPKTADGVTLVPGMSVWDQSGYSVGRIMDVSWTSAGVNHPNKKLYSTREAAIAAIGGAV